MGDRWCVLWNVRLLVEDNTLHIIDSPAKGPSVCFKLSITPKQDNRFAYLFTLFKTSRPSVRRNEVGVVTFETDMDKYKDDLSEQLPKFYEEVKVDYDKDFLSEAHWNCIKQNVYNNCNDDFTIQLFFNISWSFSAVMPVLRV
jgi:hypothetical protein